MAAQIINGKKLAEEIRTSLKLQIAKLGKKPRLAIILVGKDPASEIYVKNKLTACKEVGIYSELHNFPENAAEHEIAELINKLNSSKKIHGILLQLPLPKRLNEQKIIDTICPLKDVDGLTTYNQGKLLLGDSTGFVPATPVGILKLIESTKIKLDGKRTVVIGRSNLVGKPLALLLLQKNCTVTMCHSKTADLKAETLRADILVAAAGKPNLIKGDMIKQGAIVIDVGINRVGGKIIGDVDFDPAKEIAGYVTPVPGGVGPMTVACLLENVVKAARSKA